MLDHLRLMRLRFGLEVTSEASLPPYKGDLLRRALLWHLGTIWCPKNVARPFPSCARRQR